jgi:hypothetical protein
MWRRFVFHRRIPASRNIAKYFAIFLTLARMACVLHYAMPYASGTAPGVASHLA